MKEKKRSERKNKPPRSKKSERFAFAMMSGGVPLSLSSVKFVL